MTGLSACLSCGSVLPADAHVCPACGKPVATLKTINSLDGRTGPRTDMPLNSVPQPTDDTQSVVVLPKFLPERYEPIRLLGQGGMGAVFHCMDKQLDRPVAIKVMTDKFRSSPQGETRFMREARAQAIVNHTNVSTILNFGVSPEGKLFLVMEYLEGEDLRDFLRKRGKIDPMLACELMRQALDGLQEAHTCGLVHRDLKPSNLMVIKDHRGQPWVKILDLGLAKMVGGQTDLLTITMDTANQLIGTPAYMSPEQVAGSKVDCRADLYSMGVVFYEMIAGRLPFESESLPGWLYQHLHEKAEQPSRYNHELTRYPEIEKLPMWLLEKKPEDRPQSAAEVVTALKTILAGKSIIEMLPPAMRVDPPVDPSRQNQGTPGSYSTPLPAAPHAMVAAVIPGLPTPPPTATGKPLVKFSSVPPADRSRMPQVIPGMARRAFGTVADKPIHSHKSPLATNRAPGVVRQPASGNMAAALSRFNNPAPPPARPVAPQSNSQINLVSSISGLDPEQAKQSYTHSCSDAELAEASSNWKLALKNWMRAQAIADMYGFESLAPHIEACSKQVDFEVVIGKSDHAIHIGDWQTGEDLLQHAVPPKENDVRIETARASIPRRLVTAWMGLAAQKIRALPEGDLRRDLSERYTITCAASGDVTGAINFLDSAPRRADQRIISFAQAIAAAIRHGHTEGMRPYLDRLKTDLSVITDPAERGKASLEVGRTFAVYGDLENAAATLREAYRFFCDAQMKGIPIAVADKNPSQDPRGVRPAPTPSSTAITPVSPNAAPPTNPTPSASKPITGVKSVRASWLTAVSALVDAQAEAGLVDDCLRSAAAIDDPWTKALISSQLVQNFTKAGRHEMAERQAAGITFALPKTQALRAIAISKIYREDVTGAEELLAAIPTPAERLPILGVLAVYYGLRKDPTKPRTLIASLLSLSKQINSALPRFYALASAVEPMLSAGLNDMGRTVFEEALQLVTQIDDPVERVRCLLHLVKLKEVRRDAIHSTTRTIAFSHRPATHLENILRQALFAARQVRGDRDKVECFEATATRVAAAYLPVLATEMITAFREDADQAAVYIGLSAGLV